MLWCKEQNRDSDRRAGERETQLIVSFELFVYYGMYQTVLYVIMKTESH